MIKIWKSLLGVSLTLLAMTSVEARTIRAKTVTQSITQTRDTHNSDTQVQASSGSASFTFTSQNTDENHHHNHRQHARSSEGQVRKPVTKHQGGIRFSYSSRDHVEGQPRHQQGTTLIRSRTDGSSDHSYHRNHAERKALHRARTGFHAHQRKESRVIDLHAIKQSGSRHHSIHTHNMHRSNKRFVYDVTGRKHRNHNHHKRSYHIPHYQHDAHRHHAHYTTRIIFVGGYPVYYYPHANYYYHAGSYHYYVAPSVSTYSKSTHEPEDSRTLYELGFDWGKALLYKSASSVEFVNYLEYYIIPAPVDAVEEFRSGFNIAYGTGAEEIFHEGMTDAYDQAGLALPPQYR